MTIKDIENMGPCDKKGKEAFEYLREKGDIMKAWQDCERGEWMLWLAYKLDVDTRALTLAKARCAELVKHLMEDDRSKNAVEVAKRFGESKASKEELDKACNDVNGVYTNTNAPAYAAVDDASFASHCVAHTVIVNAIYGDDDARNEMHKQCADICREELTEEIKKKVEQSV